jgi:hypothetical protein
MLNLKNLETMGINAPKEHQRIISQLNTGLGNLYYVQGKITLEPLPKTMIDEGQTSPVPDLLLYDNLRGQTPIIIEICHTTGFKNDQKKVVELIENADYGIIEGFIYNYKTPKWWKYIKDEGEISNNAWYSTILQCDLNQFLAILG